MDLDELQSKIMGWLYVICAVALVGSCTVRTIINDWHSVQKIEVTK